MNKTNELDIKEFWKLRRFEQAEIFNSADIWRALPSAEGKGPAQRIAGVLLGLYANPKHAGMWPSQDELAVASGCTRSKASTALALLEDAGVLLKLSFTGQRNLAYVFTYLYREWYAPNEMPVFPNSFRSQLTAASRRKLAGALGEADDPRQDDADDSRQDADNLDRSSTRFEGQGRPSVGDWFDDPERHEPPSDLVAGVDY